MVKSPWFDDEVPFDRRPRWARKVICEHSTIGLAVTTDGSISDIPRENTSRPSSAWWKAGGHPQALVILLNCVSRRPRKALPWPPCRRNTATPCRCHAPNDAGHHPRVLRQVPLEFPVKEQFLPCPNG
ncbi:MAG: hypothetical protein ACLRRT_07395 [Ruthenibacterium lactatiformans]